MIDVPGEFVGGTHELGTGIRALLLTPSGDFTLLCKQWLACVLEKSGVRYEPALCAIILARLAAVHFYLAPYQENPR